MGSSADIYSLPPVFLIHTLGQVFDAFLFVYLVNGYFQPRRGSSVSRRQTVCMTFLMTGFLCVADLLSGNDFYIYYGALLLVPLLYAVFFFEGKPGTKIILCSLFTSLVLASENLIIQMPFSQNLYERNVFLFYLWFVLRRIGIKVVLLYIIQKLLLWPRKANIQLPAAVWLLFLFVSVCDNILLLFFHVPSMLDNALMQIFIIFFLSALPLFLLMLIKYLSITAEKNRISSVILSQNKIQTQYQQQQQEMVDSLRKFRHDYKAHLFCMDTLLQAGKYEELHQYLLSLHQYQFEGIHLRRFVDDDGLNIILNQKATMAERYGIRFETNIVLPDRGKISISDLNSLIVNLCDNAIEACATLPDAWISLAIHKVKVYLIIEISNACSTDVLKTNPEFHTHKSNPGLHGMGIKIIKSIAEKYHGQYQVSSTEHSFTTNLMLLDD